MTRHAAARKESLRLAVIAQSYPGDAIFDGIRAGLEQHACWQLMKSARGFTHRPEHVSFVDADGFIVFLGAFFQDQRNALLGKGRPLVGIGPSTDYPYVHTDMAAVGVLAAEHLIAAGYRNFGRLCADESDGRAAAAFDGRVALAGRSPSVLDVRAISVFSQWPAYRERLAAWLRKLPKPIGIFCDSDFRAIPVVRTCLELDIAVPHNVGVVGTEDLRREPDLLPISLTSVRVNGLDIGRHCVHILDTLSRGGKAASVLVPPAGVDARMSTDILSASDPIVGKCLSILHSRMSAGLRVADLAREANISSRMLQIRFLKSLGRTPHQEIELSRLAAARRLLAETDMTVTQIAAHCGCSDARALCVMFKRNTGLTPSQYRENSRQPRPFREATPKPG